MNTAQLDIPEGALETLDDGIGFVALVDRMREDPALKVVNSARISYQNQKQSFDEKDAKLCEFLWKHGHTSPFRHSFFTFHWKAPLFVFRQAFKSYISGDWPTAFDHIDRCLELWEDDGPTKAIQLYMSQY